MNNKYFIIGFILVLLIAIPITVFFVQKQQQIRSHANAATIISFDPATTVDAPQQQKVNDVFTFNVKISPSGGNIINSVKLVINYDPTILATTSASDGCGASLCGSTPFAPINSTNSITYGDGKITAYLGTSDISQIITSETKIATITFKANNPTPNGPTQITFDPTTAAFSSNCGKDLGVPGNTCADNPTENVLVTANILPAFVSIGANLTPTPTPTPLATGPTCTSLTVDRATTGSIPFSPAFTASGTDTTGTISKISFNFGDGPVQDVTTGGGIGTNTVTLQLAHTYNSAGTFTATATMTDNTGTVSSPSTTCTQVITVLAPTSVPQAIVPTPTPVVIAVSNPTATPVPQRIVPVSGPDGKILGIGTIGVLMSVIGGVLLFAL